MARELTIERKLAAAGNGYIDRYRLMRDRLLNVEYEHWAAGFPEGNNHGRGHIRRVLEYLDRLLGRSPLASLEPYELFLAMMSILYHDIGIIRQRAGHADISRQLLLEDDQDVYVIDRRDKDIIAAAVVSHSSSKDIAVECQRFDETEYIGNRTVRPRVVCALVRLADELDEDFRRADPILEQRLEVPEGSRFFWRFCQRVQGIRPDVTSRLIHFNLKFDLQDTRTQGPVQGTVRHFVAFCADKLAKLNHERVTVNRFLPRELQYAHILVSVKPLDGHESWTTPRSFLFDDGTSAAAFLAYFPELFYDRLRDQMRDILELIRGDQLGEAAVQLDLLEQIAADLPNGLPTSIPYEKACVAGLEARKLPAGSAERNQALDRAVIELTRWIDRGRAGGWEQEARTDGAEIHRMLADQDLADVVRERWDRIVEHIPKELRPRKTPRPTASPGGSGCVPIGTAIATPSGIRPVQELRRGDLVYSFRLAESFERVTARVEAIHTLRETACVCLNQHWLMTPHQEVWSGTRWMRACDLRPGDTVMDSEARCQLLHTIDTVRGYFEVFDLTVDERSHNYLANGLVCHNKLSAEYLDEIILRRL
jgi:hypothetical protein